MRKVAIVMLALTGLIAVTAFAATFDTNAEDVSSFVETSVDIPTSAPPTTLACNENLGHDHIENPDPNSHQHTDPDGEGYNTGHVHCPPDDGSGQSSEMGVILDESDPALTSTTATTTTTTTVAP